MAYIGFCRMIHTQLSQIGLDSASVNAVPGQGSRRLMGLFLFLGFCITGVVFSRKIETLQLGAKEEEPATQSGA